MQDKAIYKAIDCFLRPVDCVPYTWLAYPTPAYPTPGLCTLHPRTLYPACVPYTRVPYTRLVYPTPAYPTNPYSYCIVKDIKKKENVESRKALTTYTTNAVLYYKR